MKSLRGINSLCLAAQKRKCTVFLDLFIIHLFYLSSIFAVDKHVIAIKEEPEDAPVIKTEPQESATIKDKPEENAPLIPNANIYDQLWEKAQKDESLFEFKEIINKYSVDLYQKNDQGKTILHYCSREWRFVYR